MKVEQKTEQKSEQLMAKNGEFLREYGTKHFLVVSEALNIGRVKWSMVPIGQSGQNGIEFYMTSEQMLALCLEILNPNRMFVKKLEADAASSFPGAYKYVTGDEGSLNLNIGGGKFGSRVQMQDKKAKHNYTMGIAVGTLEIMARKYLLCTGYSPVLPNSYYHEIVVAFEEGRVERAKFRKPMELGDSIDVNNTVKESSDEKSVDAKKEDTNSKTDEKKTVTQTVEKPKSANKAESKEETQKIENHKVVVNGEKKLKKGFFTFDGKDENGQKISLMFRQDDAESLSWFEGFENSAATKETSITISGERKGDFILYCGPAKK